MEFYPEFPRGPLIPTESPDFILKFKNRHQLGIELTRLNPGNVEPPDFEQIEMNKFREQLIEKTKNLFEHNMPHKLFVKFLFSEEKTIVRERELTVAVQATNLIRRAVNGKKQKSFFTTSIENGELPDGLDGLLIVNHPALNVSIWERSNNLGISGDIMDDIRTSILKKEEKLKLYQKQRLNYYWLIIVSDRLRGKKNFNIHNQIANRVFRSHFQHVYLFDLMKSDIFELV